MIPLKGFIGQFQVQVKTRLISSVYNLDQHRHQNEDFNPSECAEVVLRFRGGVWEPGVLTHLTAISSRFCVNAELTAQLQSITVEIALVPAPFYKLLTRRPDKLHVLPAFLKAVYIVHPACP